MGGEITFEQIIQLLLPTPGREIWDIWLYLILFFAVITLFMQPEGAIMITLMMAAVIISIFVDKVGAFPGHQCSFGTMMIRILMFVIPLLTAGITQNPKSRAPAVIGAFLALGYTFLQWALIMNNRNICMPLARETYLILEYIKMMLV